MTRRLEGLWNRLLGSLWFVPALIVLGCAVLAVVLVEAAGAIDHEVLERFPRLFGAGAESSRSMLATIAGSVITVAGVTFSITMVAVTQASSQYTPRVLRNFMRDRPSQAVLGVFVGIFTYCLIVIRTIRGDEELRFIPSVAVLTAFVLAMVGMGFLIFFIHHMADALQASTILERVSRETVKAVDRLFPKEMGEELDHPLDATRIGDTAEPPGVRAALALRDRAWTPVPARATGYIQSVDADGLLEFAAERNVVARMERGVGEFVVTGTPLVSLVRADRSTVEPIGTDDARRIDELFTLASYRTVHQDAAFGIQQMVDIALKALSPGINDTTTAVNAVDYLGAVLVRLAGRRIDEPWRMKDDELRVIARGPSFESLCRTALDEIRRNAARNVSVLVRMLGILETVASCTADVRRKMIVRAHVDLIRRIAEEGVPLAEDRAEIVAAHQRVLEVLDREPLSARCPAPAAEPPRRAASAERA